MPMLYLAELRHAAEIRNPRPLHAKHAVEFAAKWNQDQGKEVSRGSPISPHSGPSLAERRRLLHCKAFA